MGRNCGRCQIGAQAAFERRFEQLRHAYQALLTRLIARRAIFIPVFLGACLAAALLIPQLGQNFFPDFTALGSSEVLGVRSLSMTMRQSVSEFNVDPPC